MSGYKMSEVSAPRVLRSASKSSSSSLKKYSLSNLNMFKKDTSVSASKNDGNNTSDSSVKRATGRASCFLPGKALKNGPKKVQKAVNGFAASFDQLSQRLRRSTRRRYRLTDSPFSPDTPGYRSRLNGGVGGGGVGTTATTNTTSQTASSGCMYSPFAIETPCGQTPRARRGGASRRRHVVGSGSDNHAIDVSPCTVASGQLPLCNISNTLNSSCGDVQTMMKMMNVSSPSSSSSVITNKTACKASPRGVKGKTRGKARVSRAQQKKFTSPPHAAVRQFYSPTQRLRVDVCQAEKSGRELLATASRISASALPSAPTLSLMSE